MNTSIIIDTSWLLEVYRVPGHFQDSRTDIARQEVSSAVERNERLWVTVPVLFEVANHISHVSQGHSRRELSRRFVEDIRGSFEREVPWIVSSVETGILLRADDIVRIADQFLQHKGPHYSFTDISIVDLAEQFRRRKQKARILSFDERLQAYLD